MPKSNRINLSFCLLDASNLIWFLNRDWKIFHKTLLILKISTQEAYQLRITPFTDYISIFTDVVAFCELDAVYILQLSIPGLLSISLVEMGLNSKGAGLLFEPDDDEHANKPSSCVI